MDGKRVKRVNNRSTTVAAVLAVAAIGGAPAAYAEDGATGVVHHGTWQTHAKGVRHHLPVKLRSKAYASRLVRSAWSPGQFQCLDSLWTRESDWNHQAYNRSSGAYGIPQALPAHKMGAAGWDWRSNPRTQIRWGLKYIKGRYGSPCGAWGHFRSHNWY